MTAARPEGKSGRCSDYLFAISRSSHTTPSFARTFPSHRRAWAVLFEIGARPKRLANNYFTGLFHDLPEVLTKDMISPVKSEATRLDRFAKDFGREEMECRIYGPQLIPKVWQSEMRMLTEGEFASKVTVGCLD